MILLFQKDGIIIPRRRDFKKVKNLVKHMNQRDLIMNLQNSSLFLDFKRSEEKGLSINNGEIKTRQKPHHLSISLYFRTLCCYFFCISKSDFLSFQQQKKFFPANSLCLHFRKFTIQ